MALKVRTEDETTNKALDGVYADLDVLHKSPLFKGSLVEADLTAATPKRIVHGLKRPFKGWLLCDTTGADPVYRVLTNATDRASELWLQSASDTSIKVFIF